MNYDKKVKEAGAEVHKLLSECGSGIPDARIQANLIGAIDVARTRFNGNDLMHALNAIFGLEPVRLCVKELHKLSRLLLKSRLFLLVPDFDKIIDGP